MNFTGSEDTAITDIHTTQTHVQRRSFTSPQRDLWVAGVPQSEISRVDANAIFATNFYHYLFPPSLFPPFARALAWRMAAHFPARAGARDVLEIARPPPRQRLNCDATISLAPGKGIIRITRCSPSGHAGRPGGKTPYLVFILLARADDYNE